MERTVITFEKCYVYNIVTANLSNELLLVDKKVMLVMDSYYNQ